MTPQQIEECNNRAGAPIAKGRAVLLGGYVLLPAAAAIGTELIAFARNPVVYCATNPASCIGAVDVAAGTAAGVPVTGVPVPHAVPNAGAAGKGVARGPGSAAEDLSLLDKKAATHILDGDGRTSGGHRYGTGTPGKSEFPQSWDDQKIKNTISDIATDPSVTWSKPDARGYTSATAKRDGVEVKVIYDNKNNRIVTAYPINLPKNTKP